MWSLRVGKQLGAQSYFWLGMKHHVVQPAQNAKQSEAEPCAPHLLHCGKNKP